MKFAYEYYDENREGGDQFVHIFWKNWVPTGTDVNFSEALVWAWEQFGRNNVHHGSMSIRLRMDDHAFAFRMRWC